MANPTAMTWPAADFSRVPYGVFTDTDVFELEQQRIFRGPTWTMIGLDAEVPEPGDFKTELPRRHTGGDQPGRGRNALPSHPNLKFVA